MVDRGARLGSIVGAIAGLVFVLVNAGPLPLSVVVRVVGVLGFVAVIALIARSREGESQPPAPAALRTYFIAVGFEVVAIPVGAAVLSALGHPELGLAWVVTVVGVHFVPFARAFRVPRFLPLGLTLIALGVLGAIASLAGYDDGPQLAAVVCGFVLLSFAASAMVPVPAARRA